MCIPIGISNLREIFGNESNTVAAIVVLVHCIISKFMSKNLTVIIIIIIYISLAFDNIF